MSVWFYECLGRSLSVWVVFGPSVWFSECTPRRNEIHDLMNIHEQFMNIHELFMNGNHIWFMN